MLTRYRRRPSPASPHDVEPPGTRPIGQLALRPWGDPRRPRILLAGESVEEIPWARQGSRNAARGCCTIDGAEGARCVAARCPGWAWSAAARSTFSSATLPCASRSPPTGAAPRPRAARVPCRRSPSLPGDVSCWSCSSPGSPRTRSPSSSRPCSGRARGNHNRQVAPACGLIVGMLAVPGLLPEHRPASGGDSSEGNGGVGTSARDRHDLHAADLPSAVRGGAPSQLLWRSRPGRSPWEMTVCAACVSALTRFTGWFGRCSPGQLTWVLARARYRGAGGGIFR